MVYISDASCVEKMLRNEGKYPSRLSKLEDALD